MWQAGWAGDIAWFQFGAVVKRSGGRGGQRNVGEYALHVSCPWRWVASSGFLRADDTSPGAALQAQLFYLLNRHRQLVDRRQADLFSQVTICDYIFEKDRIYACLNLDDNELFIYQRLYDLLAKDIPAPDLVIYLQAPTAVLVKRLRAREKDPERSLLLPDEDYLRELNEAYHHFFFHYSATSLLVIESSQFRPQDDDEALDALVKQIKTMGRGTRYYVPRTG